MSTKSVIIKNYSNIQEEYIANAAITPGMLIELMSTGKVRKHSTAGGNCEKMFLIEDALQGKGINDNVAAGDQIRAWVAGRGDQVNALLRDEENIAIGDYLESDGEGRLRKHVVEDKSFQSADNYPDWSLYIHPAQLVGVALEALDLSTLPEGSESSAGGDYYNPRIKIRII
jgi:hypothetical protein